MVPRFPILATCGLLFGTASAVQADGSYFQVDLAPDTSDVVAAATRGKLSFGANYSSYENGWSAGSYLARDFAIEDFGTVKIGPSLVISDARDGMGLGAKLIGERYEPTSFGFVFLSAQYNTIDNDWFALAQIGNGQGHSVDLTAGGSDLYSERSLAINYRLGDGPVSLRGGYRFEAEQVFMGLSVNTY
ncbi:hypothetical protein AL036_20170 [Salipiger aestuarii]|nr:hypothetical protein C357_22500 [Citreicella sp. 357]KAA8605216.1 hypothetical protein AL036_20170 [Salipiger aestuarii]KAB2536838.1 hypothetical protein AL035_19740 [Salipiger aestuarii]